MSSQSNPPSRRQNKSKDTPPISSSTIPMTRPASYTRDPQIKTLYDLAAERQSLLDAGEPFDPTVPRDSAGNIILTAKDEPPSTAETIFDAAFFALTLGMLHFTLSVLVRNQYLQTYSLVEILPESAKTLPVLFALTWFMRSRTVAMVPVVKQVVCFAIGCVAGCYLIVIGNEYGYYAVMKRAPPLGTLWVWSVIEMGLGWAVASLMVNVGWLFWGGYKFF